MAKLREKSGDLLVPVRLQPGASKDELAGWDIAADGHRFLRAYVRAVPEKGKANAALVKLMAQTFGLAKSQIDIEGGSKSRLKTVRMSGDDQLRERIEGFGN